MELKQNAPVLLQTCQLWAVLSALSTSQQGTAGGEHLRSLAKWEAELPELPIIAGLGFSLVDLQGKDASSEMLETLQILQKFTEHQCHNYPGLISDYD